MIASIRSRVRRRRLAWGVALATAWSVAGTGAARGAAADDEPAAGAGTEAVEDPPLTGEEKSKYDAEIRRFDKRYGTVKNRDELLQFLNELDADGSRPARDWLMKYAHVVKSAEYRAKAFESLVKIGGSTAMGFLCGKDGVRSPESFVQKQAVDALAKAGDKRCVGPLLDVLDDPALKMETVAAACITIAKIDPADAKVKEKLAKVAKDRRDTVRAAAAEARGYGADDATFAALLDTLQHDKNASVRAGAAAGLSHAGRPEAIPALEAAVKNEKSQPVREAALKSLKDLGATGK